MRFAARRDFHEFENGFRFERLARIDDQRRQRRQIEHRPELFADTAHHPRLGSKADRNVGTGRARGLEETRVVGCKSVEPRQEPQRRRGVGRAAADAGRDRQRLDQCKGADAKPFDTLGQLPRRFDDEIFFGIAGGAGRRAADVKLQFSPGSSVSRSPAARESHEAFKLVIAVGASSDDMQRQIDFRGRAIGELGQGQYRVRGAERRYRRASWRGLDPAIHAPRLDHDADAWMRGQVRAVTIVHASAAAIQLMPGVRRRRLAADRPASDSPPSSAPYRARI